MMGSSDLYVDTLRISPKFTSKDWEQLEAANPSHWSRAAEIVRDRLAGRFLTYADQCLHSSYSGFVVLAIDCLLVETMQQFRQGENTGIGPGDRFKLALAGLRFQPSFDEDARARFYKDIRCGLLHEAEAKGMWLIRRRQKSLLQKVEGGVGKGYIIDVEQFHAAVSASLDDYCNELEDPAREELRQNLWTRMTRISQTRNNRGLLEDGI